MNVEQMSVADLLRESKQAMALVIGCVGPDTRARWNAVMAEIDTRLAVGDLDEDDLEGRVQAIAKQRDEAKADYRDAMDILADEVARRERAELRIANNAIDLQFVQEAFNTNHPALKGAWGDDLSHGAKLLWAWAQENGHV